MSLIQKIWAGIATAIIVGVIVANSTQFNDVISGGGAYASNTATSLIGIKPISNAGGIG